MPQPKQNQQPKPPAPTKNAPEIAAGKDYGFVLFAANGPLFVETPPLCLLKGPMEKKYGKEIFDQYNENLEPLVFRTKKQLVNPYGNYKRCPISNDKEKEGVDRQIDLADGMYKQILALPEMEKLPGIKAFMEMNASYITSDLNGGNKWKYASRIPFSECFTAMCVNWVDKQQEKTATAKDFDKMLTDLRLPDLWKHYDERIALEEKFDGADLTEEQKKDATKQLQQVNDQLIGVLEHLVKPENKELYTYWRGYELDVAGPRGFNSRIELLKEENAVLERGWDPRMISEYHGIKKAMECAESIEKKLRESEDPELHNAAKKAKELCTFDPTDKAFKSQKQFDDYLNGFAQTYQELIEELNVPAVKEKVNSEELNHKMMIRESDRAIREDVPVVAERCDLTGIAHMELFRADYAVKAIAAEAAEKLKALKALDGDVKKRSDLYMDMRSALYNVSKLDDQTHSLDKVNKALADLEKASKAYSDERTSIFRHGDGKKRVQMADSLTAFAKQATARMTNAVKGTPAEKEPDVDIELLMCKEKRRLGMGDGDLRRYQLDQFQYASIFATKAQTMMNKMERSLADLVNDAEERKKNSEVMSDSYKYLTKAAKKLQKFRSVVDSDPDDMLHAMEVAFNCAADYLNTHTGKLHLLSGNSDEGKMRVDAAQTMYEQLGTGLVTLLSGRKHLPDFEKGETLGWANNDLYHTHEMKLSDRNKDLLSYQKVSRRLHDTIEKHQYGLTETVPGQAGEQRWSFEEQKQELGFRVRLILSANSLDDYYKKHYTGPGNEDKKIPCPGKTIQDETERLRAFPPFEAMMGSVKTWEDLDKLRDKALAGSGKQLIAEMAVHTKRLEDAKREAEKQKELEAAQRAKEQEKNALGAQKPNASAPGKH